MAPVCACAERNANPSVINARRTFSAILISCLPKFDPETCPGLRSLHSRIPSSARSSHRPPEGVQDSGGRYALVLSSEPRPASRGGGRADAEKWPDGLLGNASLSRPQQGSDWTACPTLCAG